MISVAIQHHESRAHLLGAIIAGVAPLSVDVITDPAPDGRPNPWRTYRHALQMTPAGSTHRLVVQDDVIVCQHFAETLEMAVAAQPDRMLLLFVGGRPRTHARRICMAADAGMGFAEVSAQPYCPAVATCWPVGLIEPCLEFVDKQNWPVAFRADDEIIGRFLKSAELNPLAVCPSLIEHEDVVPSTVGQRARGGDDLGRVAGCWVGDCDPRTIDFARVMPF